MLTDTQRRFLMLHVKAFVCKWVWLFQGAQLRAWTDNGDVATVTLRDFRALVDEGYIAEPDAGGVKVTDKGRRTIEGLFA